jgi:hypothetical protein
MNKLLIFGVATIVTISLAIGGVYLIMQWGIKTGNAFIDQYEADKKLVGEAIILKSDTLIIIAYQPSKNCYVVEDGRIIDVTLARKLIISKTE